MGRARSLRRTPDGCSTLFVLLCSRKEATGAAACTRGKSLRLGNRGGRGEGSFRIRTVSRGRSPGGTQKGGAGAANLAAEAQGCTEDEGDEGMEGRGWCTPYSRAARFKCTETVRPRAGPQVSERRPRDCRGRTGDRQSEDQGPLRVGRLPRSAEGVG